MPKSVMITADGKYHEVSEEEKAAICSTRMYSGAALAVPERWPHNKFRLTMIMLDQFEPDDRPNPMATVLFRKLKSMHYTPDGVIPGIVFIGKETDEELVDFTVEEFQYVLKKSIFFATSDLL